MPIPKTFSAFSLKQVKNYFYSELHGYSIVKCIKDYGGEGIKLSKHPDEGITIMSKL